MSSLFSTLSFAFDAGNGGVFWALCQGSCLVIGPSDTALQPQQLVRHLSDSRCSHLMTGPALYGPILDMATVEQLASLRTVVLGGEQLARSLAERHAKMAPQAGLYNEYGPTEATVWSSVSRVDLASGDAPSIGKAVPGCQLYVLDRHLRPVPVGVPGELYVGGPQVARGYLDDAELTAERFVPDLFSDEPGKRLYRTGDLARYRNDGDLEFLGRSDNQVKVRGFRIELGEIEAALNEYADIRKSAVVVHSDEVIGSKRLVAYSVRDGEGPLQNEDLQAFLKTKLPDYMVPSVFVFLDDLPLTANGKLDRNALPSPDMRESALRYAAPRTPTEQLLSDIWQDVLGIEQVGIHDNFFELGGDSILSIQIISKVNRAGLGLTVKQLFERQTIAELARVAPERRTIHAEQGIVTGPVPLTPIQHWFFEGQPPQPHHCNHAVLLKTASPLDPQLVETTLHHLLLHHDALRSRFDLNGDEPQVEIGSGGSRIPFSVCDLSELALPVARKALTEHADRQQRSLHLTEGPLLRGVLYRMGHGEPDRLLIVIHHLVVDGVSWRILIEDFETAYAQLSRGQNVRLPAKTTSFRQWSQRLQEYTTTDEVADELDYWRDVLQTRVAPLPRDYVSDEADNTMESSDEVVVRLSAEMTQRLLTSVPEAYNTQINDSLLAALLCCLSNWTREDTVRIVLEGHGREELFDDIDLSRTVGVFTSFFPVVLSRQADYGYGATLKSVKEQLRAVPHRGMRFGLLKYLHSNPETREVLAVGSTAEIAFNYLGRFDGESRSGVVTGLATESTGATQGSTGTRRYTLEVNGILNESQLELSWGYSSNLHNRETITALAADFIRELELLIEHCGNPQSDGYTASDFGLASPTSATLETLFDRWGRHVVDAYPLAPMQQRMLFHSLFEQNTGVDLIQLSCRIEGSLRPGLFRKSWQQVLDRHPALRTAFLAGDGNDPLQIVLDHAELPWEEVDLRQASASDRERRLTDYLKEDRIRGFAVDEAPLTRCALIRLDDDLYQFIWSHHHLLTDGWCLPILLNEALAIYEGLLADRHVAIETRRPFRDYVEWLCQQDSTTAESFWRENLSGFSSPTPLGIDRLSGPSDESGPFLTETLELPAEATAALQRLAQTHHLTLSVLVQGAWSVLLSRYSGATDVVFGATVSGRPPEIADVDSMIGLFINTLPVRVKVDGRQPLVDFLSTLQDEQVARDVFAHAPLVNIQSWSQVVAPDPLFESVVVFENYPMDQSLGHLLESLAADAEREVSDWQMMPDQQRQQLLVDWNNTQISSPDRNKSLTQLFEAQVEKTPDRVAVMSGEHQATYSQLNGRANQLARRLCEMGIKPGTRVGIFLERSIDMLAGLLAVGKAGAAYVPMDPAFPSDRLSHMLDDARTTVVLTQQSLLNSMPRTDAQILSLDGDRTRITAMADNNLHISTSAANPAYVIYTSGSTGKPKGVEVTGNALVNFLLSMQKQPGPTERDVLLAVTTISFDIAALELFLPLVTGAQVILADREMALDGSSLIEEIRRTSAMVMQATPVTWRLLLEAEWSGPPLSRAMCGGEALPRDLAARLLATGVELWNLYGPTETTIWSSVHRVRVDGSDGSHEPIGRPIDR